MEEDRLLQFHEKLKDFLQRHLTFLINVVIVFVILIFISGGYVYYKRYKEKKALNEYVELIQKNADIKSYKEFVKKYKNTQAGIQATISIWNRAVMNNDLELMKGEVTGLKKIYPSAIDFLPRYAEAKIYEESGNSDEAIKIYNSLLEKNTFIKEFVILDLALLQEKKNREQALKLYQQLLSNLTSEHPLRGFVENRIYSFQRDQKS